MKRFLSISLVLMLTAALVCSLTFSSSAQSGSFIYDEKEIFGDKEYEELEDTARSLYDQSGVSVCYLLTDDLGSQTAKARAEELVNTSLPSKDAFVLVDSYDQNDYVIEVYAFGSAANYENGADRLDAAYNSYDTFVAGVKAYLSLAQEIITGESVYTGKTDSVEGEDGQLIVDGANLLTDDEKMSLTKKAQELSEKNRCSLVIVTAPALNGKTATAYADDYYDYHGYKGDGVLLLIALDNGKGSRAWAISTKGKCISGFSESEQEKVIDDIKPSLSSLKWNTAFDKYLSQVDYYLSPHVAWYWIPVSLIAGFGISMLIMKGFKSQLSSVHMQKGAKFYIREGSMKVTQSRDTFLYHTVTKTAKPKDTGSSSGGGGGHISSSGSSHGGSSGTF